MDFLTLLKLAAATWYIAYSVTSTHGPGGVFDWLRENVWHGRTVAARREIDGKQEVAHNTNGLLDCPICLAIWVALLLSINPDSVVVNVFAVAGVAMLAHSWAGWRFGN